MRNKQAYRCPTCNATKTIKKHPLSTDESFQQELPESLPCGWNGCEDRAVKVKHD